MPLQALAGLERRKNEHSSGTAAVTCQEVSASRLRDIVAAAGFPTEYLAGGAIHIGSAGTTDKIGEGH